MDPAQAALSPRLRRVPLCCESEDHDDLLARRGRLCLPRLRGLVQRIRRRRQRERAIRGESRDAVVTGDDIGWVRGHGAHSKALIGSGHYRPDRSRPGTYGSCGGPGAMVPRRDVQVDRVQGCGLDRDKYLVAGGWRWGGWLVTLGGVPNVLITAAFIIAVSSRQAGCPERPPAGRLWPARPVPTCGIATSSSPTRGAPMRSSALGGKPSTPAPDQRSTKHQRDAT
jgi:hypothetical protein